MSIAQFVLALSMPLLTGCAAGAAPAGGSAPPMQSQPAATPADSEKKPAEPAVPSADEQPSVDALLDQLEHSVDDLTAFTADLHYEKFDPSTDRNEIRRGSVILQIDPKTRARRFALLFNLLAAPIRKTIDVRYVFDGSWLAEIDADRKQFTKRQIVAPGKTFDPLKLGEGPLPLPLGQKKSEVLRRFDVQLIELPKDGPLAKLTNIHGLRLVPKPGTPEAKDFLHVDLFYDRTTLLPTGIQTIGARLVDPNDPNSRERKTIALRNLQRNPQLTDEQLRSLSIEEPDPKQWEVTIEPWRE